VCTQQLTRIYFSWVVFVQASQFLRIITFYSTQLPGPNYHCREVWWLVEASSSCGVILPTPTCLGKKRLCCCCCCRRRRRLLCVMIMIWEYFINLILQGSPLARLPPPQNAAEVLLINCKRQLLYVSIYSSIPFVGPNNLI